MSSSRFPALAVVACVVAAAAGYFAYQGRQHVGEVSLSMPAPGPIAGTASERVPDGVRFTDLAGTTHGLDEYRGKLLIVNFWATWCGPCLHEIPALIKIQHDYGARGLQLVGPAVDDPEDVRAQAARLGFNYPVFVAESEAMLDLMTRLGNTAGALPFSVVIAPDGRILRRELGEFAPAELAGLIEAQLAPKP